MSAVASKNHPLVIFIDDLQWADASTLAMLTMILSPPSKTHYLLILGAYRENEVSSDHPFMCTVTDIITKKGHVQDLVLKPLALEDVESLVRDSCSVNQFSGQSNNEFFEDMISQERALAKEIHTKTEGNPFFINQLLTTLYQDSHIELQTYPLPHWICNIEHVKVRPNYLITHILFIHLHRHQIIQTTLLT